MSDGHISSAREIAIKMKEAYDNISPYIESQTAAICPSCERVCCIDRHGSYEEEDIAFLLALDAGMPDCKPKEIDTEPCRYLDTGGCVLSRWQRPFRCTWYFCDALLAAMPAEKPREYRIFIEALRQLQETRMSLLQSTDYRNDK